MSTFIVVCGEIDRAVQVESFSGYSRLAVQGLLEEYKSKNVREPGEEVVVYDAEEAGDQWIKSGGSRDGQLNPRHKWVRLAGDGVRFKTREVTRCMRQLDDGWYMWPRRDVGREMVAAGKLIEEMLDEQCKVEPQQPARWQAWLPRPVRRLLKL